MELKWFRSYLTDREQRVTVKGSTSSPQEISCGVRQGLILGPLLFRLFINDLPTATDMEVNLFANDTSLQLTNELMEALEEKANAELGKVTEWFETNKLTTHPKKTRYMILGTRSNEKLELKMNGQQIERVGRAGNEQHFKFLGIQIDDSLNWRSQTLAVKIKINKLKHALQLHQKDFSVDMKNIIYKRADSAPSRLLNPNLGRRKERNDRTRTTQQEDHQNCL